MPVTTEFTGLRVLLVEDEPLVCLLFEDMLAELGCEIIGPACDVDRAIALARDHESIQAAILDVNVAGQVVFPVAEILSERGIPFSFATGLSAKGLPAAWQSYPMISKPVTMAQLAEALRQALRGWRREVEAAPVPGNS